MRIPLFAQLTPLLLPQLYLDTPAPEPAVPLSKEVTFSARHAHSQALDKDAPLFFADAAGPSAFRASSAAEAGFDDLEGVAGWDLDAPLVVRTKPITMRRPQTRPPHMLSWAHAARALRSTGLANATGWIAPRMPQPDEVVAWSDQEAFDGGWEDVEVDAPDVTDRQTLLSLAKMASNAYVTPDSDGWYPLAGFNNSIPFGWEPDSDGLRGHVFADDTNSTVVIAIKGTSAGVLGSGGPTSKNDKFNDNLMFSCCCARVDFSWSTVCDCYAGGYKCGQSCVETALVEENVYAAVGTSLYNNVTYLYPDANIWLVGHSLGGSLAALIAQSFGAPAVGFEAPGDRLPTRRLHLPQPPAVPADMSGIVHVYHTADPIPMGACTGTYSGCYAAGFALESKCHTGQTILYDTVTVKGWSVDIRTHRISEVISRVLADPWPVGKEPQDPEDPKNPKQPKNPDKDPKDPADDPWDDDGGWDWGVGSVFGQWWGWGRGPKGGDDKDDGSDGDDDDGGGWEKHGGVPRAHAESDCVDCYKWEFGDDWEKK